MQTYLEIKQKSEKPEYLMVMLHGYGSHGADMIELAPYFAKYFPQIYFYSPNGVERHAFNNFGYQWFDLQNRNNDAIKKEITRNADKIIKLIETKLQELGLDESKLILLGFSQGTMTSLFLGLSHKIKPAGIIGFSGKLTVPDNFDKNLIDFPICLIHGMEDDVLSSDESESTYKFLSQNNIKSEKLLIPNLGHTIDLSGIEFAKNFIESNIINKKKE